MPQKPELLHIPRIQDPRGNLSFIQDGADCCPFKIERVYWIYDVPGGRERHGHAFRRAEELIVAMSGSFDVVVTEPDGTETIHHMARSYYGLHIPAGTFRAIRNFSTNSVAMVLSSTLYDPDDYIYDVGTLGSSVLSPSLAKIGRTDRASLHKEAESYSHKTSSLAQCRVITLPRHRHENGSLSVVENSPEFPFAIRRVFYLYDVPADAERGGHSHHRAQELIVAASGAFDVVLSDGHATQTFSLNRPYEALYIPAGIWRELNNFSGGSVCMVLTSECFSEEDYVREIEEFNRLTHDKISLP